jgi:hypothetical protein
MKRIITGDPSVINVDNVRKGAFITVKDDGFRVGVVFYSIEGVRIRYIAGDTCTCTYSSIKELMAQFPNYTFWVD